jgi:hypothetical protein
VRARSAALDPLYDGLNVLFSRRRLHHDHHLLSPTSKLASPGVSLSVALDPEVSLTDGDVRRPSA